MMVRCESESMNRSSGTEVTEENCFIVLTTFGSVVDIFYIRIVNGVDKIKAPTV
jgi:hypothetical protein